MSLLAIDDLCVSYGHIEAVRGVSLTVEAGQIATVIGPNGAGKTSMLGAVMGLHRGRGRVTYDGTDVRELDVEERVERGLCLVPEQRELFGAMSVADNLLLGSYSRRRGRTAVRQGLEEVFGRFPRLKERRSQRANTLSGGERQMLALGRALMSRPRLLMLDEPSLGLAPIVVRESFPSSPGCGKLACPSCWWNRMPVRRCRPPISALCSRLASWSTRGPPTS